MSVFTLTIAIFGATTGIISLIIQFIEYRKSKVKLRIKIEDRYTYYTTGDSSYKCEYFGIVSLKLSNCSALPITLDEVFVKTNYYNKKHIKELTNFNTSVPAKNGGSYDLRPFKSADLPLRIDCYDSVFISFRFPFFDEYINKDIELVLVTPRKEYKMKINVKDIMRFKEN